MMLVGYWFKLNGSRESGGIRVKRNKSRIVDIQVKMIIKCLDKLIEYRNDNEAI